MNAQKSFTLPGVLKNTEIVVHVTELTPRSLSASLFARGGIQMLAHISSTPATDCRVALSVAGDACIWIGRAAFDIPLSHARSTAESLAIELDDERDSQGAAK